MEDVPPCALGRGCRDGLLHDRGWTPRGLVTYYTLFVIDLIFTDDTTVTIARGSSGKSRKGRAWICLDQEGNHFYDFTESRKRDGPLAVLQGYSGFSHADAYPGYDVLFLVQRTPTTLRRPRANAHRGVPRTSGGERSAQVRAAFTLASEKPVRQIRGEHQGPARSETPVDRQSVRRPRASARRRAATGSLIRLASVPSAVRYGSGMPGARGSALRTVRNPLASASESRWTPSPLWWRPLLENGAGEVLTGPRKRGVVGGIEIDSHQRQHRPQESLRLAKRQLEDESQRQGRLEREIRELPLPASSTRWHWRPRIGCVCGDPQRDVAALCECTVVLRPVADSVFRLEPRMHSRLQAEIVRVRPSR